MRADTLYEERFFSLAITGILAAVSAIMFFMLFYQLLVGPLGSEPAPNLLFLIMGLLFLGFGLNFSRLLIRITPGMVTVGYGLFRHRITWNNIEDCRIDETLAVKYGGWGVRVTKVGGKWRLVYSVVGGPRVLLALRAGRFREFVFSTRKPEEVTKIIRQNAGVKDVAL
ncbi:MAG: hypothetical protein V3W22_04605 [Thermoplasmata archaeon]